MEATAARTALLQLLDRLGHRLGGSRRTILKARSADGPTPTAAEIDSRLSRVGVARWGWPLAAWMPLPRGRAVWASILSTAILLLAALAGPHLIEHLLVAGGDADHCPVCAALQGSRSGVPMAPPAPLPALPVVGSPPPQSPQSALGVAIDAYSTRAPPLPA